MGELMSNPEKFKTDHSSFVSRLESHTGQYCFFTHFFHSSCLFFYCFKVWCGFKYNFIKVLLDLIICVFIVGKSPIPGLTNILDWLHSRRENNRTLNWVHILNWVASHPKSSNITTQHFTIKKPSNHTFSQGYNLMAPRDQTTDKQC